MAQFVGLLSFGIACITGEQLAIEGIEGGEELGVETGGGEEVLGVEGGGGEELVGVAEGIGGVEYGGDEEEGDAQGVAEGAAEDELEGVAEVEPGGPGGEDAPSIHGTISFYKDPILVNQQDLTQATDPTFSNGDDGGFIVQASTGTVTNGVHATAVPHPAAQKQVDSRIFAAVACCCIFFIIIVLAVFSGSKDVEIYLYKNEYHNQPMHSTLNTAS